ncbi:MAG: hypothetical protein IJ573_00830 [Clostridia bacterium]|nr:hypothetical protein [Clostridia bacterium]
MKRVFSVLLSTVMFLNCFAPLPVWADGEDGETPQSVIDVHVVNVGEPAPAESKAEQSAPAAAPAESKAEESTPASAPVESKPAVSAPASAPAENEPAESAPAAAPAQESGAGARENTEAAAPARESGGDSASSEGEESATANAPASAEAPAATEEASAGRESAPAQEAPAEQEGGRAEPEAAADSEAGEPAEPEMPSDAGNGKADETSGTDETAADGAADTAAPAEADVMMMKAAPLQAPAAEGASEDAEETQAKGEETGYITERKEQDENLIDTTFGTPDDIDKKGNLTNVESSYELCVDENGVYQLTFKINEGVDVETITVDLTKALEELQAYAGATGMNTLQPGDTRTFQIWITSDSDHTYRYSEGSFILTTPEQDINEIPEDPTIGFDGQELDKEHTGRSSRDAYTNLPAIQDILIEMGLDAYDRNRPASYQISEMRSILLKRYGEGTGDITTAVINCLLDYYSKKEGTTYTDFATMLKESPDAARDIENTGGIAISGVKLPVDPAALYDFYYKDIERIVYGDNTEFATGENKEPTTTTKTIYTVTDHDGGAIYTDCYPASELGVYYVNMMTRYKNQGYPINDPAKVLIYVDPSNGRMIFGFENADGTWAEVDNFDGNTRTLTTHESSYRQIAWHQDEATKDATVEQYMLGEDSETWKKVDAYFESLLADGISASEASAMTQDFVKFMMAVNIDFYLAGNGYQSTQWGWHNTIDLERVDGELHVEKVDENDNPVTSDETTFQLWYYKNDDKDQKYYYTSYETEVTDDQGNKTKQQTKGFVKYDPDNKNISWTIDTTGGKLDISYAMLENIIYYLQEKVAPEGYELDKTVYIICDSEEDVKKAEELLKKDPSVDSSKTKYAGRIDSEDEGGLRIKVVNVKNTPTPAPKPTPTPGVPGDNPPPSLVTIGGCELPRAGLINMNEGDCFD